MTIELRWREGEETYAFSTLAVSESASLGQDSPGCLKSIRILASLQDLAPQSLSQQWFSGTVLGRELSRLCYAASQLLRSQCPGGKSYLAPRTLLASGEQQPLFFSSWWRLPRDRHLGKSLLASNAFVNVIAVGLNQDLLTRLESFIEMVIFMTYEPWR